MLKKQNATPADPTPASRPAAVPPSESRVPHSPGLAFAPFAPTERLSLRSPRHRLHVRAQDVLAAAGALLIAPNWRGPRGQS